MIVQFTDYRPGQTAQGAEMDAEKTATPADFKPNYKRKCTVCGATPTVDVYSADAKALLHHVDLCGPCTWGDADCIDPENW